MTALVAQLAMLRQVLLVRYLGASIIALGCDFACFLVLLELGLIPASASALAYALGIAVHWFVSSRKVFVGSVASHGPARTRQKTLFAGSALVGLAVTTGVVAAASSLGLDPRLAKLAAVGASFTVTWLLRDSVVFRKTPAPQ